MSIGSAKTRWMTVLLAVSFLAFITGGARAQSSPPPLQNAVAADPLALPEVAKMPDVFGVRLGMSPAEAVQLIHKQLPADRYQESKASWWPSAQKPDYGVNVIMADPLGTPEIYLSFTAPPAKQAVWKMVRYSHKMHVNHATLLAALRQKYGKESFAAMENGTPTNDERVIGHLIWLFDEHGARAPMPPVQTFANYGSIWQCIGRGNNLDSESQMFIMLNPTPRFPEVASSANDWCSSSFVGIHIAMHAMDIVEIMVTEMVNVPLGQRTARISAAWQQAGAEKARQAEIEKSKQSKPVL